MDIIVDRDETLEHETRSKAEVLAAIEPAVEELMDDHLRKRRLWFPNDFLPADEQMDEDDQRKMERLKDRARSITDAARVSIALNMLTEEGLPHFHRVIAMYLAPDSIWQKWNFMWTAEEDRHGVVLHEYARDARIFSMRHLEQMQYAYLESGFTPSWDRDPYRVFVYTTLQERATQFAHRNTGRLVGDDEPVIQGIFRNVAADEARHFQFYRKVFKAILEVDPNRALESALAIMPSIDMPGISMPNFRDMADVVRRAGIYGPWDYKKIVEEAINFWKIDAVEGLNEVGRKAQDKIMNLPRRLQKVAEFIDNRTDAKTFGFDFIYNRAFAME